MVSVIIPNWNGRLFLEECLASLRAQTHRDLEMILVDDGSTDSSIQFVKESFSEVRILKTENNEGFSRTVNRGLRIAAGEFIALLNNDAMADRRWLEELIKGIDSSQGIGFCTSKILRAPDGETIDTAGDRYTRHGVANKRGHNMEVDGFDQTKLVFGACAVAALYRKSMLEEIGYCDEDLFCIYEDVDLSFRA